MSIAEISTIRDFSETFQFKTEIIYKNHKIYCSLCICEVLARVRSAVWQENCLTPMKYDGETLASKHIV